MEEDEDYLVRFDSAIEFKSWEETPEGYLIVNGTAAKTGVMTYVNADGSPRRELVDEESLKPTVEKLMHLPVLVEHPRHLPRGFVDSTNVTKYQKGEVIGASYNADTGEAEVRLIIRDKRTVEKVKAKKLLGLSPGYKLQRVPADGQDYDYIQRDRQYNHLALTKQPRRGMETSIHLDSAENAILEPLSENPMEPDETTPAEPQSNQPAATAPPQDTSLDSLSGRIDALTATVTKLVSAVEPALDSLKPEPKPEPTETEAFIAAYQERERAITVASALEVEIDVNTDSTLEIKSKIVAKELGDAFDSEAGEGYIDAAFAYAQRDAEKRAQPSSSLDSLSKAFVPPQRSNGFEANKDKFKPVDPTRLERERAYKPATQE